MRRFSGAAAISFGFAVDRAPVALLPRSPNRTASPPPFFCKPRKCLTLKECLFARTWRPWLAVFVRENRFDKSRLGEVFRKHAVPCGSWVLIDRHEKNDRRSPSLPDLDGNDGTLIMPAWLHSTSQVLTPQQFPPDLPEFVNFTYYNLGSQSRNSCESGVFTARFAAIVAVRVCRMAKGIHGTQMSI